ncbi:MAG: hypothetical protein ABUL60_07265 [Myxococcales bacterium]
MKTSQQLLGILLVTALTGCGDDGTPGGAAASGGAAGSQSAGGTAGTGGSAGSGVGTSGTAGSATGGAQPAVPFVVEDGICRPNPIPGPKPLYEIDSVFGHVGPMAARGDTLYFGESADFDDIPPRIAKLEGDGPPTTFVAAAHAFQLRIIADKLYYVDAEGLKSVDLAAATATPTTLNKVANIVTHDDKHVVYKDETNYYAVAVGAPDLTGAVTLRPIEGIYSVALAGDTLYLSSREGVSRVGVDGTGAANVVPDDSFAFINMVASDGTSVFFDDHDTLKVVPAAGGTARSFGRAGPDSLFFDTAAFSRLLPAGDRIYWADDGSSYGWTALDGMSCGILGTHDGFFEGGATLADNYLFASGEATVYRVDRVK